ncbi:MAG: glucose-6-phosphate dehydrogenase [Candidatus Izemoplasmatales bacterium]
MKQAIVIFGSTGNLMYKKLIPALDKLIKKEHLDESSKIYCIARKDFSLKDYIADAKKQVTEEVNWEKLVTFLEYIVFDVNDINDYLLLKNKIKADGYTDLSIYLAVPPNLFPIIAKGVSESKLISKGESEKRIVFEKPFGENLNSAKKINRELWKYFDEKQIYRIDHYLGKEMIQNILVVRFANVVFNHIWNNSTISSVSILSKEKEGVMSRGGYYDKIGALKDMLQSHLLQMASLIAMDKPTSLDSEAIKDEKVKVLKDMIFSEKDLIVGQYKGYLEAKKVAKDSNTETFVYAKAYIENDTWKGVPFHFLSGKKLDEKLSEIIIHFKDDSALKAYFPSATKHQNKLIIRVAPKEGVQFQLNVKEPGLGEQTIPASLDYCHSCDALKNNPESYEKLLLELLNKNRTLFTRWDEIETTWNLVDELKSKDKKVHQYETYQDMIKIIKSKGVDFYDF